MQEIWSLLGLEWNGEDCRFFDGGRLTGAGGSGGNMFENDFSAKILDREKAQKMWDFSSKIVGAKWPAPGPESLIEQEERLVKQQKGKRGLTLA